MLHIVGAGRGGTSLLAALLDYHSKLEVGFETNSVAYLMGRELPYSGPELFHRRVSTYLSACRKLADQHPKKIWGNKITTEQIFGLEDHNVANPETKVDVLDMFFNKYLEEKAVIFILRDGRTCINSKVRRTGQPIESACDRWKYSVDCYKFFRNHHKNNICVRFEDVCIDPKATLIKICRFLNIPYQRRMIKGTVNKKLRPEYQNKKLEEAKTKTIDIPEDCAKRIVEEMKYCGYI